MQPAPDAGGDRGRVPSLLLGAAHLAALWAFAFAQPLLNLLAKNPEFFVARHNSGGDIVFFAVVLVALPPLAMLAVEALAGLIDRRVRWALHLVFVGLLAAAIALQFEKSVVSHPAKLMVLVAVVLGVLAALAYARTEFVPQALSVLSPAPLVFLAWFLLVSDVSQLVLPQAKPKLAEAAAVHSSAPVVVLFLDEFPATSIEGPHGQIDARRYPHFAELAASSTWYRNATTVADQTVQAIPALMSGLAPRSGALPNAEDHPRSLFSLLGGRYRLDVTESVTSVCPRSLCRASQQPTERFGARFHHLVSDLSLVSEHLLLPDAIRAHLPPIDQTFGGFRGGGGGNDAAGEEIGPSDRAALFQRFLTGIDGRDRTLHFLHLEIPHRPWEYLPSGERYPLSPTGTGELQGPDGKRISNRYAAELSWQRHLLQAGYADRLVGQLIARLKAVGIWRKALVVVTPDHGMAFVPSEPPRNATAGNFDQIAGVPTFIKAPGQTRGRPSERHICTTDVLPIVAGLLNTRVPWTTAPCAADPRHGNRVVIQSGTGSHRKLDAVSEPFAVFERDRARTLAEKATIFGAGDPARLFALGGSADLLGKRASTLAGGPAAGLSFSAKDPALYASVNPAAGSLPALLQGKFASGLADGEPLAVAVNGHIAAITRAFTPGTRSARVLAMIPPGAFRAGRNLVELFELVSAGGQARLQPVGGVR
ncbi:MAG: hypothetical protein QOJ38_1919 [Solirubrobacterales bacterium]|jgi:hypothetical protein|nr:hypothetical protein [Solirubrobacterales bacterium]